MLLSEKLVGGICGIAAIAIACSTGGGADDSKGNGGGQGASTTGGTGGTSASGGGPSGGSGGGINIDSGTGATSGAGGNLADACAQTGAAAAEPTTAPADIIWVVDQSGSMDQEAPYVQNKINEFANAIGATNIDYHVVMIASTTQGKTICVPPPLSGGSCGDGPRFRLVNQYIDSNDPLDRIIDQYPKYSDFLRPGATKHFIVVTDDNATDGPYNSAVAFTNGLNGLTPAIGKWIFHSIYAYGTVPFVGCFGAFGTGAAYGTVYEQLVAQTGGAQGVICTGDWTQVFAAIQSAVVIGAKVSCEYPIPDPGTGQTLDPTKVNVEYLGGGNPPAQQIFRVSDLAACNTGSNAGGWYYDDNNAPTKILLCPDTCTAVQSDPYAKINVIFGCESVYKPPS